MAKEAWVIKLIDGIMPRWADSNGSQTSDKRKAKIYNKEDDAISDFCKLGSSGFHWPFAEINKVTLRK